MKVKIGDYPSWFGPYQLAEALCFWVKEDSRTGEKPDWLHDFGEWLAHGEVVERASYKEERPKTLLYKGLLWLNEQKKRKVHVRIDDHDIFDFNHTLSYIILPGLIKLREKKHGSPYVDDCDVPEEFRSTSAPPKETEWDIDDYHHHRWDYVLNEMIWAFNEIASGADPSFVLVEGETTRTEREDGLIEITTTTEYDKEARRAYEERKQKAFEYFGKYYQNLWD